MWRPVQTASVNAGAWQGALRLGCEEAENPLSHMTRPSATLRGAQLTFREPSRPLSGSGRCGALPCPGPTLSRGRSPPPPHRPVSRHAPVSLPLVLCGCFLLRELPSARRGALKARGPRGQHTGMPVTCAEAARIPPELEGTLLGEAVRPTSPRTGCSFSQAETPTLPGAWEPEAGIRMNKRIPHPAAPPTPTCFRWGPSLALGSPASLPLIRRTGPGLKALPTATCHQTPAPECPGTSGGLSPNLNLLPFPLRLLMLPSGQSRNLVAF